MLVVLFHTLGGLDLREPGHRPIRAVLAQPKRTALLAYLSVRAPHGLHSREALLALFWPELDEDHARRALSQSLYYLRRTLGAVAMDEYRRFAQRLTLELEIEPSGETRALY